MTKYSELIKESKKHPTLEGFMDFIQGKKAGVYGTPCGRIITWTI